MDKHATVEQFLPVLAEQLNGTPAFSSTDAGVPLQVNVKVTLNEFDSRPPVFKIQEQEHLRADYPDGFHVLRIHDVQSARMPGEPSQMFYLCLEVQKKQEGELSDAEKKEHEELKLRVKAEQELEAESLVLDSLENGIVDLIRASDDSIAAYEEMSDAKKKVIRSHLNTLQALMRL